MRRGRGILRFFMLFCVVACASFMLKVAMATVGAPEATVAVENAPELSVEVLPKGEHSGQGQSTVTEKDVTPAASVPADTKAPVVEVETNVPERNFVPQDFNGEDLSVQAVLSSKRRAVIASSIDGKITKLKLNNGDTFRKGQVLVEYDCSIDQARLKEIEARQRATQAQFDAYEKLKHTESVSQIEYLLAKENNEQNIAMVEQIKGRLEMCTIVAPFDGRVTNKMASQFEFAQTGRVLMDIGSREALRAEFLIPSIWLRWLNVGTPLRIYINETDRSYLAKITAIHGEVDPVSQSIQIVSEMEKYHEELLPGMSGQAIFTPETAQMGFKNGFIGLSVNANGTAKDETN